MAAIFAAVGIKLTKKEPLIVVKEVPVHAPQPLTLNAAKLGDLGITPRELEILGLIAQGLSNRGIAERLFVSENTVKTHSSRLFDKLSAKRRTQAVQIGKELGLIPLILWRDFHRLQPESSESMTTPSGSKGYAPARISKHGARRHEKDRSDLRLDFGGH
jgi:DNA-binding CsgD family transcriptional regulator